MRVAVIGTGHVGLVTCVTLAHLGHDVGGTDVDAERIAGLRRGETPFYEPDLEELLHEGLGGGRLRFERTCAKVVPTADVVFICVSTPPAADGETNLLAVEHSASEVGRHARGATVVVEKSTVPAGTAVRLDATLRRESPELQFDVVSNPEFLREGSAIADSLEPDRILVGADSDHGAAAMRQLYEPLVAKGVPLIETDIRTAELAKHACNAFLALKVSYANALARICDLSGADIEAVAEVMGSDNRIGRAFLGAGLGYGGYCFPKDLAAFERLASKLGYDFPLLREIARINDEAVEATVAKIRDALWNVSGKRIALLGLAFKPHTDDIRNSPSLELARRLTALGGEVVGFDPQAAANAKDEAPELQISSDAYEAVAGAHAAVIGTAWPEFRELDLGRIKDLMAYPVMIDARNALDANALVAAGFAYYPMGRPPHDSGEGER